MILILFASAYITILCWSWGAILFKLLQKIGKEGGAIQQDFIITCFSGLAFISVIFSIISFFFPLGGLVPHLSLLLPSIIAWVSFKNTVPVFRSQYKAVFKKLHPIVITLLITYAVLILLMGAVAIKHPDTLNYHAQCIKWIENYKAVPGLANLDSHYGLQSSWFILCALFSFKFTGIDSLTFLNCTVIFWLIIFISHRINECLYKGNTIRPEGLAGMMWLALLIISFWSYNQVRLTVTSASPDFIAAMYIWLIFYLVLFPGPREKFSSNLLLIVFLSFFASTIKLSAVPVILLAFYYYYRYSLVTKKMALLQLLVFATVVITPAVVRNIITTGYPLYPSPIADFCQADWKVTRERLFFQLNDVTTYARVENIKTFKSVAAGINFTEWLPVWWHNRSVADKVILVSFTVLLAGNLLLVKKIRWQAHVKYLPALFFSLAGLLFWFLQAPDPRFGFGFIITSEGILLYFLSSHFLNGIHLNEKWLKAPVLLFSVIIMFYSFYRLVNFFESRNIILPAGVVKLPYKTIECQGIKITIPPEDVGCGDNGLPCVYVDCSGFILRGNKISDGFRPAKLNAK